MSESIASTTPPRPIEDAATLAARVDVLARAERIALDAEGDGFHRYRPRLCVLQLAAPGTKVAIVDTLAIDALDGLASLLGPHGPLKVVHDASFDARMLLRRGIVLDRVLDTAVAARFLGETATGLASLSSKYLGVALEKEHQQADWGERPLSMARLAYLEADVAHLVELSRRLEARLRELDLLDEVEEESRYVLAMAREPEPVRAPWTRIKGARDLPEAALALLAALADVREEEAERQDVPPFRIAPNAALLEAAQRARDLHALRRVRGLRALDDAALEEALARAERDGPPHEPVVQPPPAEERARRRSREKALSGWRTAEAARRGVNEQAVLPGHCLRDLADVDVRTHDDLARVPGIGAKRLRLYGDALTALLAPFAG
jgi:ribonuclease D